MEVSPPVRDVMIDEHENIRKGPISISGIELTGSFLNVPGDPIEYWILPSATHDLKSGCISKLLVQPVVTGRFHLAEGDQFFITQNLEIGGAPRKGFPAAVTLQDNASTAED
jgi:hypothetical protein